MGSCLSCAMKGVSSAMTIIQALNPDFTISEWINYHEAGTPEENQQILQSSSVDLSKLTEETFPASVQKAVFICCMSYTKPEYSLGVGPINDAITVSKYMSEKGFRIYYLHNPSSEQYLYWLKIMLQRTTEYLFTYYTGHGTSVEDVHGDEADGFDEAYVFEDRFVIDDELLKVLCANKKHDNAKVVLFSDCCHSGSIWDLQNAQAHGLILPPNVVSISAAQDSETAKQTVVNNKDQGIFTFHFFKIIDTNPKVTLNEMSTQIAPNLTRFTQKYTHFASSESLYTQSIL